MTEGAARPGPKGRLSPFAGDEAPPQRATALPSHTEESAACQQASLGTQRRSRQEIDGVFNERIRRDLVPQCLLEDGIAHHDRIRHVASYLRVLGGEPKTPKRLFEGAQPDEVDLLK